MGILSKLTGSAKGTAARSTRTGGRSTAGTGMGGGAGGRTRGRGTTGRSFSGFTGGGRTGRGKAAPASSGGLGKLIGSLTGRR